MKCRVKKALRNRVLKLRDQIPSHIRERKTVRIKENLFSLYEFNAAKTILFYASFRSEVETHGLIREALAMGKRLVLPKVDAENHALILYEIKDVHELSPGYMSIPEPDLPDERRAVIADMDLAIIPGAAFDLRGNRLGYGAGYYDGLLSQRTKKILIIALAFEDQLVDAIPAEKHDVKVAVIVTDKRVIRIL